MSRIAIPNLFDTLALNGKKNGGVKIYIPQLTATTLSDGKTGYKYTGKHVDAKKMIYQGNVLYNIEWSTGLDAKWFTYADIINLGAKVLGGNQDSFTELVQSLTAETSAITHTSASAVMTGQTSKSNDFYIMIRTVTEGTGNKYFTNFEPVSIVVSGANASDCIIRGVSVGNETILRNIMNYAEHGDSFSAYTQNWTPTTDTWLDDIFNTASTWSRKLENYLKYCADHSINPNAGLREDYSGVVVIGNITDTGATNTATWRTDGTNRYYVNTNCGCQGDDSAIGQCMLFNLQLPTNTTSSNQSLSVKFVLNSSGTTAATTGSPTDTSVIQIVPLDALPTKYILSANGVGYYFDSVSPEIPAETLDDNSTIAVSASTSGWKMSDLNTTTYTVFTSVTYSYYYYQKGVGIYDTGDTLNYCESDPAMTMPTLDTPTLSVDSSIFTIDEQGYVPVDGLVPALCVIKISFYAQHNETLTNFDMGSEELYVYNDLNTINDEMYSTFGKILTYEEIANDFNIDSYPGKGSTPTTYTYSITTTQAGCKVVIGSSYTLTTSSTANQTYSTSATTATGVTYTVSKTGYDTLSGSLAYSSPSTSVTLTETPVTTYTYSLTVPDIGASITIGESAYTSVIANTSYTYTTTATLVGYTINKSGYSSIVGVFNYPTTSITADSLTEIDVEFASKAQSVSSASTAITIGISHSIGDFGFTYGDGSTYNYDSDLVLKDSDENILLPLNPYTIDSLVINIPQNTSGSQKTYTIMIGEPMAGEVDDNNMFVYPYDTLVITQAAAGSSS